MCLSLSFFNSNPIRLEKEKKIRTLQMLSSMHGRKRFFCFGNWKNSRNDKRERVWWSEINFLIITHVHEQHERPRMPQVAFCRCLIHFRRFLMLPIRQLANRNPIEYGAILIRGLSEKYLCDDRSLMDCKSFPSQSSSAQCSVCKTIRQSDDDDVISLKA